ncbi:MAG: hypothetical protein K2K60_05280 [Clostridia bacterium]|nr:hypothetical protein [Clostridia bacterium]
MIKKGRKIAVSLLGILSTLCIAGGVSACKNKSNPMMAPENATTVRMVTPNDGSLPTAHTALENVGYMAYTLDNQAYYNAYANNSSKAMGYEQITQTWKVYKSAPLTGIGESVLVSSDISYSSLVKSALQTCSIGNREAYTRGGGKPGKNSTPTTVGWSGDAPAYYDKDAYFHKYGEFSTELCVYVINEYTIADSSEVTVKEDGTFEQTYYLNEQAGCWYQYKMKTNGGLKKYPKFERVQITFNFDSNWRVLSSYCEEKMEITPGALGGIPAKSDSKTTTTFYYGENEFDNAHYAYFDDYFKQYLGTKPGTGSTGEEDEPSVLDIIGSGFSKVMGPEGQQFNLDLTLGDTEYTGKVYAKLADMGNVLNTLDVRVALERKGSGQQDLFIQFKEGDVKVYYSDDFALKVNIGSIGTVVNQFKDWIKIFAAPETVSAAGYSLVDDEDDSDSGLGELLAQLKYDLTDDAAYIDLKTDNLMGTGIGANLNLDFNRTKDEDGSTFSFRNLGLNSITYDSTSIKLAASILPDETNSAPISREEKSTAADLADYANSVYNMLNSDTLKVDLALNGNGEGVLSALEGANVALTAYLKLGNELSLKTDISAAFGEVSAKLSAYYGINLSNGGYGVVYLNLTEVNGKPMDAKIRCNIDETVTAVKQLISSISGAQAQATAATYAESDAEGLAQIINKVLCIDFGKVLGDIYASNSQIRLGINVDEVIAGLGLDVNGLKFGTAALALNNGEKASFNLNLPKLGLTASVSGSTETVALPDENNYLNVIEIVNLVKVAADEAQKIIDAKDITFDINAKLIIDDIPLSVKGSGEVVWVDGKIKVAVDVTLAVADGTSEAAKNDAVALKLLFDPSAEEGAPIAKFAVNSLGMEIYQSDLDETKAQIENIINSVKVLLDGNKTGNATPEEAVALLNTTYDAQSSDNVANDIITILQSGNVQTILKTVLNFVSGLTSFDLNYNADEEVSGFVISHAVNGKLELGTDGDLSIALEVNNNNGTRIVKGSADVKVGNGNAFTALEDEFANGGYTFTNAADAEKTFVKVAYDYLFAVIENMSIADVLDGRTYTVQVNLNGAESAIPALQDITANAKIRYTEGLDGDKIVKGKLAEIDVDLNIKGVTVSLNARYNSGYIFIELRGIANYTFSDIKVKANANDIYAVAEQVVDLISSKAVLDLVGGKSKNEEAVATLALAREGETKTSVTGVLAKLFTLNFSEAFSYKKVNGVNTAIIKPDYILNQLGVAPDYNIGVITVGINPVSHAINADINLDGNKWLTASAEPAARPDDYTAGWENGYIDISFISTLLSDITKTAINGDTINKVYTFTTGTIDVSVVSIVDVKITDVNLTVGLDENNQLYVSLLGYLNDSAASTKRWISITYSGGYITLGRDVDNAANAIYKVMTFEYFLDNILDKNNSPIFWLLATSSFLRSTITNFVKLNINTGLTKPESLYLYEQTKKPKEDKAFALGDFLKSLSVKVDGKEGSYGGNCAAVSKWKLTDNYYAFDINGDKLTGGTLKTLYAAIIRDANGGLSGLKAYAEVMSYIKADISFGGLKTDTTTATPVPDYFKVVKETYNPDFDYYKNSTENKTTHTTSTFGCYNSENNTYESSEVLSPVTLTVIGYEGAFEDRSQELRYGSTVYLTNTFAPVWANEQHTQKLTFTDAAGNDLGSKIVLDDAILGGNNSFTVKAVATPVVEVNFRIGVSGIDTVNAALASGETLSAYDGVGSGYSFVGWYNDEEMTQKVTSEDEITNVVNGVKTVYGKFVKESETVNGVIYTFTADESEYGGSYAITGFNAEQIAPFTAESSWLILENELYSVPVTSIAETAFAQANLKNVVVPENIVTIGSRAFLDNYGIKTVVITANEVYFAGKDKNTAFYGCSTGNGTSDTYLHVYYNSYKAEAGSDWGHFRDGDHYIDRGSNGGIHSGGSWSFVQTVQGGVSMPALNCNILGVRTDNKDAAQLAEQAMTEINTNTANAYGYINAYVVNVSGGYSTNGKINVINIDVQDAEAFWYPVTIDGNDAYVAGDYVTTFNGVTYAKAGETVTVRTDVDHYISSATSAQVEIDATDFTFTMPDNGNGITVTVVCEKVIVNTVTLKSIIALEGYEYVDGWYVSSVTVTEAECTLTAPTAENYVFLGWAYENGGNLSFTGSTFNEDTVASSVYYAVWAYNADGKLSTETSALVTGTNPNDDISNVKVNTLKVNSLYKWYTNAELTQEANTITSGTTVLYAKVYYTVTFKLWGNSSVYIYYDTPTDHSCSDSDSKTDKKKERQVEIAILEGDTIQVEIFDNGNQLKLTYGEDVYWIRAKKVGTLGGVGGSYAIKGVKVDNETVDLSSPKQLPVNGNMLVSGEF